MMRPKWPAFMEREIIEVITTFCKSGIQNTLITIEGVSDLGVGDYSASCPFNSNGTLWLPN